MHCTWKTGIDIKAEMNLHGKPWKSFHKPVCISFGYSYGSSSEHIICESYFWINIIDRGNIAYGIKEYKYENVMPVRTRN